jgi:hypothetical protein
VGEVHVADVARARTPDHQPEKNYLGSPH